MWDLQTARIQCPYCWQEIEIGIDCSVDEQDYIEDCSVCCKPIRLLIKASAGELADIEALGEND